VPERVPAQQYAEEVELVGPEANFDESEREPGVGRLRPGGGDAAAELALLEQERDANPSEPLWTGVRGMAVADGAVRVEFAPRSVPHLLPVADAPVEVSCHLYHPPEL
jgi:hypothetical protein